MFHYEFYYDEYSDEGLGEEINKIVTEAGISTDRKPHVYIGMDTR